MRSMCCRLSFEKPKNTYFFLRQTEVMESCVSLIKIQGWQRLQDLLESFLKTGLFILLVASKDSNSALITIFAFILETLG